MTMSLRPLGRTGMQVTPLGFGAFKIGRNQKIKYPRAYDLPDEQAVGTLLNSVLDLGINLIDTAPAYGLSEERIGQTIAHRRGEYLLSTKVGEQFTDGVSEYRFDERSVRDSIEQSLRRLRTDYLDLVFIHTPADDLTVLTETDVVPTLKSLQQAGLIRAVGLSGKTVAAAEHALQWADLLMVEYNALDESHRPIIGRAAESDLGVLVKKGLAAGHLPPEQAIPFVLQTPGVSTLVVGGLCLAHLLENIRLAERSISALPAADGHEFTAA